MVCVNKLNRSQQPQQSLFPVASEVEVSSDEEGLHGAWFVAKVLPLPPNRPSNTSLFVEYKTLVSDDKRLKPLREFADISFVRPLPPSPPESEKAAPFDLNVAVDAYHLDGWWTGVVTEVLGLNRYKVSFPNPPDVIEFEKSSLRLHRDWVDGRWVVPKKQIFQAQLAKEHPAAANSIPRLMKEQQLKSVHSFTTINIGIVGLFAKDPNILRRVVHVLLRLQFVSQRNPRQIFIADDCFELIKFQLIELQSL